MFGNLFKKKTKETRVILAEVLADLTDKSRIEKALEFYDNYESFSQFLDENNEEVAWMYDEYEPSEPEIAYEIFNFYLNAAGWTGFVDWADGVEGIIEVYDELLAKISSPLLSEDEKYLFRQKCKNLERGDAYMSLWDSLHKAVEGRELVLTHINQGQDAHFPLILKPEVYKRWVSAKFDKRYSVI